MARKKPPLIAELARLIAEYPEKDWRSLADLLQSDELIKKLAATVETVADLAAKSRYVRKTKPTKMSVKSRLAELAKEDPEKAQILTDFRAKLTDRVALPSVAQIRGLATAMGMKEEIPSHQAQAVDHIIRHLADKTVPEIKNVLSVRLPEQRDLGLEYTQWVDLILGDDPRNE